MKKNYFLLGILFFTLNIQAQFIDDMESCTVDGDPANSTHWTNWGCGGGPGCDIVCSSVLAHTGEWSGLIPGDGTTDAALDLGNKIFGEWAIEYFVYIPSGKEGFFSMLCAVPIGTCDSSLGQFYFNNDLNNPGVGTLTNTALGTVSFNFPQDQWFRVVMYWDIYAGIELSTWAVAINNELVVPEGTPFTDEFGVHPPSLGGINFFSISTNNELYVDDLQFIDFYYPDFILPPPSPIIDDMEYDNGESLEDWWSQAIEITTDQANSGTRSGVIPDDGTTAVMLDLNNTTLGVRELDFWMYIPVGKEASWSFKDKATIGTGASIVGDFTFNNVDPGAGYITDANNGAVFFEFLHGEWFPVSMKFDFSQGMSNTTWEVTINNVEVLPEGTPFTNSNGDIPSSLGGIEFFSSNTNNIYYLDDFTYGEQQLGINNFVESNILIYPNPSKETITISTSETIREVLIYSITGNKVLDASSSEVINISRLATGMYFVIVETDLGKSVQKLIKN